MFKLYVKREIQNPELRECKNRYEDSGGNGLENRTPGIYLDTPEDNSSPEKELDTETV